MYCIEAISGLILIQKRNFNKFAYQLRKLRLSFFICITRAISKGIAIGYYTFFRK